MFTTGQRVMFKEVPLRVIGTKRDGMIVCEDDNGDETAFTAEQLRGDRVPGETANYIVIDDPMTFNQTPAQMQQATAWFNKTIEKREQQTQEPQPMSGVERFVHGYYMNQWNAYWKKTVWTMQTQGIRQRRFSKPAIVRHLRIGTVHTE